MNSKKRTWVPTTPAGSVLMHLAAKTEQGAWDKLMREAAHMPYKGREGFEARGYEVHYFEAVDRASNDRE